MSILLTSLRRQLRQIVSRRLYVVMMLVVPVCCAFFFTNLMNSGLPLPVPVALVDRDGSSISRQVTRALQASQYVEIVATPESYAEAMDLVQRGKTFGFFYIPESFQQHTLAGEQPTLSFYTNMSIFVPGTMSFKGFKTIAVTTKGGIVQTSLVSAGVSKDRTMSMLQPVVIQDHPLNNPWMSYSVYLNNSFMPALLALVIMLTTAFSICTEIKRDTSQQWLETAGGSIVVAMFTKLLPQTVIFSIVGFASQALFYVWLDYPMNCPWWNMLGAMILLVTACQALAVLYVEACPNMRLSLILCAVTGILSFSVAGFSFPVPQMYGGVGIFAYMLPIRYYFLIYVDQALNGIPLYYSRWWYAVLCMFPLVTLPLLPRLKGRCLKPIYVP